MGLDFAGFLPPLDGWMDHAYNLPTYISYPYLAASLPYRRFNTTEVVLGDCVGPGIHSIRLFLRQGGRGLLEGGCMTWVMGFASGREGQVEREDWRPLSGGHACLSLLLDRWCEYGQANLCASSSEIVFFCSGLLRSSLGFWTGRD